MAGEIWLVTGGGKGGPGKTTLSRELGTQLALAGSNVRINELDWKTPNFGADMKLSLLGDYHNGKNLYSFLVAMRKYRNNQARKDKGERKVGLSKPSLDKGFTLSTKISRLHALCGMPGQHQLLKSITERDCEGLFSAFENERNEYPYQLLDVSAGDTEFQRRALYNSDKRILILKQDVHSIDVALPTIYNSLNAEISRLFQNGLVTKLAERAGCEGDSLSSYEKVVQEAKSAIELLEKYANDDKLDEGDEEFLKSLSSDEREGLEKLVEYSPRVLNSNKFIFVMNDVEPLLLKRAQKNTRCLQEEARKFGIALISPGVENGGYLYHDPRIAEKASPLMTRPYGWPLSAFPRGFAEAVSGDSYCKQIARLANYLKKGTMEERAD